MCYIYSYCVISYMLSLRIAERQDVTVMHMGIFRTYHSNILRCHNAR